MQFGLFGSAAARRGGPEFDSSEGFRDFIEYNIEAEALGFHSTFVVEHHFTGYGQVSASEQRGGQLVAAVTSPFPVVARPYVQDLQYVGATSGR